MRMSNTSCKKKKNGCCGITKILPRTCKMYLIFQVPTGGSIRPESRALVIYDPISYMILS